MVVGYMWLAFAVELETAGRQHNRRTVVGVGAFGEGGGRGTDGQEIKAVPQYLPNE